MLVVVNGSKQGQDAALFAALDVFAESGGDRFLLGAMAAEFLGLFDEAVVEGEVGRHTTHNITHYDV